MAAANPWTQAEIQLIVADYMAMLTLELCGQRYNKAAHNRALLAKLPGRNRSSVEFKHQNISAVLRDIGQPWIIGYKPMGNRQAALALHIVDWLEQHGELQQLIAQHADQPPATPGVLDWQHFITPAPMPDSRSAQESPAPYQLQRPLLTVDYSAREARNAALGLAGEQLVLSYEQQRLERAGHDRLAAKVEHIAKTRGDGAGFDILSFNTDSSERFIEVKTTTLAAETPFYLSRNELLFSQAHASQYHLFRVFNLKQQPRAFVRSGALDASCQLEAVGWRGW
nr:DUF3883 domain-containing protein [Chromobacterium sp. ASV5]